jgi:hypothetical protein
MTELPKLWNLRDKIGINIRARYIRSEANVWVDSLSIHFDNDDWQLDPVQFAELNSRFGPHCIDRFASALNILLPRYKSRWLDLSCEAVNALHFPDLHCTVENNSYNFPWPLLPNLALKFRHGENILH